MPYRSLRPDLIVSQTKQLRMRIIERFPDRSILNVCDELLAIAQEAQDRTKEIATPNYTLRIFSYMIGAVLAVIVILLINPIIAFIDVLAFEPTSDQIVDVVQLIEADLNAIIILGAAIFFLVSLDKRTKQNKTLRALHELRSLAHVIDMHQLTKDPERLLGVFEMTPSSPEKMTPFELTRYLDYCSEMLSIIGKIAALYVQEFDDEVAISAVNEIENLTSGLSRKIWQKIMIVHQDMHEHIQIENVDVKI
ncbi:MAG: hypothetical protein AAF633_01905 [Chloroflexota bacterium]